MVLIELQYLPPLEYFSRISGENTVLLEAEENFSKQSYRNRSYIRGANGVQMLNIPVIRGSSKTKIRELRIDHDQAWQNVHWRSILSAYGNAPFFDFYLPYVEPVFLKRETFLWDFNLNLLTLCLDLLGWSDKKVEATETYVHSPEPPIADVRSVIHPKKSYAENQFFTPIPYIQVFGKDFVPNLSIIDLLFCQGPDSPTVLKDSARY
jgi:hypothetical protein